MLSEPQGFVSRMLAIGIHRDDGIDPVACQRSKPCKQGRSFPLVTFVNDDHGAGSFGCFSRAIRGTIVNQPNRKLHVVSSRIIGNPTDNAEDCIHGLIGGNEDSDFQFSRSLTPLPEISKRRPLGPVADEVFADYRP